MDRDAKTSIPKHPTSDPVHSADGTSPAAIESETYESETYIGQWHGLVSTTNWHKGQIIHEWRVSLNGFGGGGGASFDETWSQLVGGVSGQHVGRLRARVRAIWGCLFAIWRSILEPLSGRTRLGRRRNVAGGEPSRRLVRRRHAAAAVGNLGSDPSDEPRDGDLIAVETDEDFVDGSTAEKTPSTSSSGDLLVEDFATRKRKVPPDLILVTRTKFLHASNSQSPPETSAAHRKRHGDLVRPFADLADLPDDLSEAFESFQLAILRHKAEEWQEVSLEDVLASLDALKSLALFAPVE